MANYYKILGVAENATGDEIKRAYRLAVKKYHPDLHPAASPKEKAEFEAKTKEINEAYSVLSDPKQRAYYDSSRLGGYGGYSGGSGSSGTGRTGGYRQEAGSRGYGRTYGYGGWQDYGFSNSGFEDIFGTYGYHGGGKEGKPGSSGRQNADNGSSGGSFSQKEWEEFIRRAQYSDAGQRKNDDFFDGWSWGGGSGWDTGRSTGYGRTPFGWGRNSGYGSYRGGHNTSLLNLILYSILGRRLSGMAIFFGVLFLLIFGRYIFFFILIYFVIKVLMWFIRAVSR